MKVPVCAALLLHPTMTFNARQPSAREAYLSGGPGSQISDGLHGSCVLLSDNLELCSQGYACTRQDPPCPQPLAPMSGECCNFDRKLVTIGKALPW